MKMPRKRDFMNWKTITGKKRGSCKTSSVLIKLPALKDPWVFDPENALIIENNALLIHE